MLGMMTVTSPKVIGKAALLSANSVQRAARAAKSATISRTFSLASQSRPRTRWMH